jgi:hypothetical protein
MRHLLLLLLMLLLLSMVMLRMALVHGGLTSSGAGQHESIAISNEWTDRTAKNKHANK